jgi:hypothetical protein
VDFPACKASGVSYSLMTDLTFANTAIAWLEQGEFLAKGSGKGSFLSCYHFGPLSKKGAAPYKKVESGSIIRQLT